ncbi:MAG: outer membrane beta-barrel protein, partial [Flavobacteriales bacterium]|nr:outer membrane beta-barrel protein [Flavobacteriales bacterium]
MKTPLVFIATFLITTLAWSQSTISAGFIYGASTSTFAGASDDEVNWRTGDRFGVMMNFAPLENFSIEPQFIVSKKGAQVMTEEGETTVDIRYAELPIMFNVRIPLGGKIYPTVFAGPYFATRVS